MKLDPLNIGLIITTLVTVLAGWASQRSASRTSRITAKEQAEQEAYSRAQAMDAKTIVRQNEEIEDLTNDNTKLRIDLRQLKIDNERLLIEKRALLNQNSSQREQLRGKRYE